MLSLIFAGLAVGAPISEETRARLKSDALSAGIGAAGGALVSGGFTRLAGAGIGAGIGLVTAEAQNAWSKHSTKKIISEQQEEAASSGQPTEKKGLSEKEKFQLGNNAISAANGAAFGAVAAGPFGAVIGGSVGFAASEGISHLVEHLKKENVEAHANQPPQEVHS